MPKRNSKRQREELAAIEWANLPDELFYLAAGRLDKLDLKRAASVCKHWRQLLLTLLLQDINVVLADVQGNATRTRSSHGWLDLPKLLRQATATSQLSLLLSERKLPRPAQIAALQAALAQQPAITKLRICILNQLHRFDDQTSPTLTRLVTCLLSTTQTITSLHIDTSALASRHLLQVSTALAHLTHLDHLTYNGSHLVPCHITPLTSLTTLTSLHLTLDSDTSQDYFDKPIILLLQQLAALSQLRSLTLHAFTDLAPSCALTLPPWPHLQHLHIYTLHTGHYILLSPEHCAQLQSLHVQQFCAAEGVGSMPQLTSLTLALLPAPLPAPAQALLDITDFNQQLDIWMDLLVGEHPYQHAAPQQLDLPRLQQLALLQPASHYFAPKPTAQQVLALVQQAPALLDLDLQQLQGCCQQAVVQLLGTKQFRSLKLPPDLPLAGAVVGLQRQLQRLALCPAPAAELAGLTSLQALELSHITQPQQLAQLPPQLTALTALLDASSSAAAAPQRRPPRVQHPPLRQLVVNRAATAWWSTTLQLPQLTGLTSLTMGEAPGAAAAGSICRLTQLAALRAVPWPGMARQLLPLPHLASLALELRSAGEVALAQRQVRQLAGLTQLAALKLEGSGAGGGQGALAAELQRVLPHCLVVNKVL